MTEPLAASYTAIDRDRSMLDAARERAEKRPRAAAREMARVLTPGGRLVIGELARFGVWTAERRLRGWFGARRWRQAHFWSRSDLERLVTGAGLRVQEVRGSVFYPPSGIAARTLAPLDPLLGRMNAPGAAFLATAADNPPCSS